MMEVLEHWIDFGNNNDDHESILSIGIYNLTLLSNIRADSQRLNKKIININSIEWIFSI